MVSLVSGLLRLHCQTLLGICVHPRTSGASREAFGANVRWKLLPARLRVPSTDAAEQSVFLLVLA